MPFPFSRLHTAGSSGAQDVLRQQVKSIMSSATPSRTLIRVALAFGLFYPCILPLLVPVDSFGVGPDSPGVKRSH